MVYKFFDKKSSSGSGVANNSTKQNMQLAKELYKPVIRNFKKRKVYSGFKENIWGADLVDKQLISKFNKGFRFFLCVIYIFSKYAWVVPLKDKKGGSIVNAFHKILKESSRRQNQSKGHKPNKIWVEKGREFWNSSFKNWLKDSDIEMYSTHNERKSVFTERFIRTLKTKIYKSTNTWLQYQKMCISIN